MLKTETVFHLDSEENQEDNDKKQPTSSSGQMKYSKASRNEDWLNTRIPPTLDKNAVCTLFEAFLGNVNEKDRKKCINGFRKQKLTGKTLVEASENQNLLTQLEKTLNLPFEYKVGFDKMMAFIKQRQNELNGGNRENGECTEVLPQKSDCELTRKRKLSPSEGPNDTIGAEVRHAKYSKGRYKDVNVKRVKINTGKTTGLRIDATDNSEIEVEGINVTDEQLLPPVKEES